jgi:hypothetical protein
MNKNGDGVTDLVKAIQVGLRFGPLVRVDLAEYADASGLTLRSVQRYAKSLPHTEGFVIENKRGNLRYFRSIEAQPKKILMEQAHQFCSVAYILDHLQTRPIVVSVVLSLLSYIYIYTKEDLFIDIPSTLDNHLFLDNDLSFLYSQLETTKTTHETTPTTQREVNGHTYDVGGAYEQLKSMVCHVCKLSPLLVLEDDEAKVMKMFRAGITADLVFKRYSRSQTPNFWYNGYWKGKKNAWPSIVDIMSTWEHSADYLPSAHDSWPGVLDIQEQIIEVMQNNPSRYKQQDAIAQLAEIGYDKIVDKIEGGYPQMMRMPLDTLRVKIAVAVRDIRKL